MEEGPTGTLTYKDVFCHINYRKASWVGVALAGF